MIILPIVTTSLIYFSLKVGRMYLLSLLVKGSKKMTKCEDACATFEEPGEA